MSLKLLKQFQTKLLVNSLIIFQSNTKSQFRSTTKSGMMLNNRLRKKKKIELQENNSVAESVRLLSKLQNSRD